MLTSVELFAGAGGLGMGMTRAGFRHLAAIERDRFACDTIRRNTDWPVHQGDVRGFDYESIPARVDIVAGGPPCQPFSMGGKHKAFDDRRDMFPAMADAVRRLRPRAFIVENVRGLVRPAFAEYFGYVLDRLRFPDIARAADQHWSDHARGLRTHLRSGRRTGLRYDVSFRVLNAADHGVPQIRQRVFIVGFRDDLAHGWMFPEPTHSRAALLVDQAEGGAYWDRHRVPRSARSVPLERQPHDTETLPWRTVRDALAGLPDPTLGQSASPIADHRFQPGARFYPGHTGSVLDLPAKTLKAGDHGVPGGENALRRADGTGRYFTVREAARLQTFPDDYVFGGAWSEVMRQLGNAVPVTLAHVVGAAVARTLLECDAAALV